MNARKALSLTVVASLLALPALAQMGRMGPPTVSGVWKPEVGSGAAYKVESQRGNADMEITVVGSEAVKDKTGYWLETTMIMDRGQMVSKTLMLMDGKEIQIKRLIMQMPGQEAMDMSEMLEMGAGMGMMRNMGPQAADLRETATHVGSESVTTPAGTFACEHYRSKDGTDVWIAEKVAPYGMVKTTTKDSTITLTRVITGAKSKITGPVKKFDPEMMMRRPPQ